MALVLPRRVFPFCACSNKDMDMNIDTDMDIDTDMTQTQIWTPPHKPSGLTHTWTRTRKQKQTSWTRKQAWPWTRELGMNINIFEGNTFDIRYRIAPVS